ncbi:MAG: type II/IV secretion system ATPase subunit [Candidatus Aenigmatarchaeota archaeon]
MKILKNVVKKIRKGYLLSTKAESVPVSLKTVPITEPETVPITVQPEVQVVSAQPIKIPIQAIPVPVFTAKEEPIEVSASELTSRKAEVKIEGIDIPKFLPSRVKAGRIEPSEETVKLTLTYPLIPKKPAKGEPILAYAKIFWDDKAHRYFYQVIEPQLTENLKNVLKKVKELLEQKLDIEFSRLRRYEASEYLKKQISEIISYYGFKLNEIEKQILQYYVERDFIGLGKIEPLMNDEQIEDISCDGLYIPIFIFHRHPRLGSVVTNIVYEDPDELDSFIIRLAQISGKSISVASPLLSASLPDGSRIQATLATDIARRGSNFTIRKFTEKPLTPVHLLNYGTVDLKILAYLWLAVDFGKSVLVSGGTASGKTSFLNVLSLFIRPEKKIVSIEDTPELKLPHPHWVPHVARTAIAAEEKRIGEIDLFDLLKESLRQRPDYIIVGEVRGREAYVLFQEMATGHPSLATIHAENLPKLTDRLTTPPISLPSSLISSVDIITFLLTTRYRDKQVRRVNEILEVVGYDADSKQPIVNQVFKWNPINDTFDVSGKSVVMKKIADTIGMSEKEVVEELERRMLLLDWMQKRNITEYKDVNSVINQYYSYPERVISAIIGAGV